VTVEDKSKGDSLVIDQEEIDTSNIGEAILKIKKKFFFHVLL
jgi:hypothetical protein